MKSELSRIVANTKKKHKIFITIFVFTKKEGDRGLEKNKKGRSRRETSNKENGGGRERERHEGVRTKIDLDG